MENKEEKALQPEVAEKYEVTRVSIGKHHFNGFGVIDLTKLSLMRADALAGAGFYWLKPKGSAAAKEKTEAAAGKPKVEIPPVKV